MESATVAATLLTWTVTALSDFSESVRTGAQAVDDPICQDVYMELLRRCARPMARRCSPATSRDKLPVEKPYLSAHEKIDPTKIWNDPRLLELSHLRQKEPQALHAAFPELLF